MRETILGKLDDIERKEEVNILYAAESGSRAWGFASHNSDWDCRFIYKRPLPTYITIHKPKRDVIELPIEDDLDFNGWDIFKALTLLGRSNPPLMEWLFSPIVYLERGTVAESMRSYVENHYSHRASAYHYLHMAKGNYESYLNDKLEVLRKKYLYVLRPLICIEWMRSNKSTPPTSFVEALDGIMLEPMVDRAIRDLIDEKISGEELGMGPHDLLLDHYIRQTLEDFGQWVSAFPVKKPDYRELDSILHQEVFGAELARLCHIYG